ncbi:MAG: hypothetical protein JST85_23080 [Acidobacteria bacterium]|nr:hypothetical protein [Acidobacteriota bacterium]
MRGKTISILLCLGLILNTQSVLGQQSTTPNQSWDALKQTLTAGKVMVETKSGKKRTGQFTSISDTELVLERKGKPEPIPRAEVKTVWTVAPPSRAKQTAFGALGLAGGLLGGVFIAVGLGFKECGGSCADEGTGIIAALIGLPVAGLFAGRALAGNGKRTLVFSAP